MAKDKNEWHNIQLITGLHFTKGLLKSFFGMTFFINPFWKPEVAEYTTFPVSFFSVKSMTEIMESNVSTKQMLFYDSTQEGNNNTGNVTTSVNNVISDNIVIQPKQYKMEIIVPYSNLSMLENSYVMHPEILNGVYSTLYHEAKNDSLAQISSFASLSNPFFSTLMTILKVLVQADFSSVSNFVYSLVSTPDFNKRSLEAMWRSRSIIKMKTWNNWRYKYVAIKNMEITKEGTSDGVYEATLILQEVPMLSVKRVGNQSLGFKNPVLKVAGEIATEALNALEQR